MKFNNAKDEEKSADGRNVVLQRVKQHRLINEHLFTHSRTGGKCGKGEEEKKNEIDGTEEKKIKGN